MKRIFAQLMLILVIGQSAALSQDSRQLERPQGTGQSEKRIALLIGNGDYVNARKLANPANDAADIANAIGTVGFEVIAGTNLSLKQMTDKVREFGDKMRVPGAIRPFSHARHAVQKKGRNYAIFAQA